MKNKLRDWLDLNWDQELFEDFLCAVALLGFIVFALTWGLGGTK